MLDYKFKQLESELRALEILKDYSEKALEDYIELSKIYEEILSSAIKFKSLEQVIQQYEYYREQTHYALLELDLENKSFNSRCGTRFDFELYEEILEKVSTNISILFLQDSILEETKLKPFIIDNNLKYTNKWGISVTPEFTLKVKDIKHLSEFMKQMIPKEFHKFNGIK